MTETTDWYSLTDARCHLLPYQNPMPEVAVASAVTPSGSRLAAKHDLGMLCLAASEGRGFEVLARNWATACELAAEQGREMDRARLRLAAPFHIAETREQAMSDASHGIQEYIDYTNDNQPRLFVPAGEDPVAWWMNNRGGCIGTPDDAIRTIQALLDKQGEFGVMLNIIFQCAEPAPLVKSLELYQRYVAPHFDCSNIARQASYDWVTTRTADFDRQRTDAAQLAFERHAKERAGRG